MLSAALKICAEERGICVIIYLISAETGDALLFEQQHSGTNPSCTIMPENHFNGLWHLVESQNLVGKTGIGLKNRLIL